MQMMRAMKIIYSNNFIKINFIQLYINREFETLITDQRS